MNTSHSNQKAGDSDTLRNPSNIQVDLSGVFTIFLEALTLFSNLLPASTVFLLKTSRQRTVTEYFIGALALNDILSVAIPLCVGVPTLLLRKWVGSRLGCELYQVSIVWFQLNGMLLVTAMSCDRVLALKRPAFYRRTTSKTTKVQLLIISLCFADLLVACMPLVGLANTGLRNPLTYCPCLLISKPSRTREHVFPVFMIVLGYCAFVVVFVCNFSVIKVLRSFKSQFELTGRLPKDAPKLDRPAVVAFTKLVFVLGTLFYLTWAPVMVLLTLNQTDRQVDELTAVYAFSSLTINSLAHPLAYGVFSVQFRQGYWRLVRPVLSVCSKHCLRVAAKRKGLARGGATACFTNNRAVHLRGDKPGKYRELVLQMETAI